MKKFFVLILTIFIIQGVGYCGTSTKNIKKSASKQPVKTVVVQSSKPIEISETKSFIIFLQNGLFGLKDKQGNILIKPQYKKLIRVGENSWIVQLKNRFGLVDNKGKYLVQPKYRHVDRYFGRFSKFGNEKDFGLYDERGQVIIKPEYSFIEPLFSGNFLTCKNYKYGVISDSGKQLIENEFDYIYMPEPHVMRLEYKGKWYEIEKMSKDDIDLPEGVNKLRFNNTDLKVTDLVVDTGFGSMYGVVSIANYALKIVSSLSPAYEETIDELMYSQGADAVPVIVKCTWIPKFPFVYAKKYYENLKAPNNGPLKFVKDRLRYQISY